MVSSERFQTVIIGGGQAGLAAAYCLKQAGDDFIVLESNARLGETWHRRWDSLRLFTPSKFNSLPGMRFPGSDFYFPAKDEVAAYLLAYAERFELPVRLNTTVDTLTRTDGTYSLTAGSHRFSATNVIVATGAFRQPVIPLIARDIDPAIFTMHSNAYTRPDQLPQGTILVVGAGNSGAEIAIELAKSGRIVWLSGRDVGSIPADRVGRIFGGRPYWFFISRVLSTDTPIGRKVRGKALHQGSPLIRLNPRDAVDAGVTRCPRLSGTSRGLPQLEDGRILQVAGIVWATGFRPDFRWIQLPVFDEHGGPLHVRGVVQKTPGLFFLGLHFQHALSSALLGGVGADAQHVVRTLHRAEQGDGKSA
jgi:putative flavoprotein involved in K+ transport